jgi:hypothetical protein
MTDTPITEVPDPEDPLVVDIDATILASAPELETVEPAGVTDELRELMTKILDPEVPQHELSFRERKFGISLNWLQ